MYKMKLLVVPLTSGDIERLKRCIYTIESMNPVREKDIEIDYDIKIVVNTQDKEYEKLVQDTFEDKYHVEITESDGTPGTGKNAVFDFYRRQKKKYDYLFQIDGDDVVYSTALHQLSQYFKDGWDMVSFQSMDWLSTNHTTQMNHAVIIPEKLWLFSWCDQEVNLRDIKEFEYVTDKDFGTKGGRIFTPGTTMVFSNKLLQNHPDVRHTNEIKLFEDYLYFLKIFKLHIDKKIKMCSINNSYIYLYDRTNENSISTHNCFYGKKELGMLRGFCEDNDMMDTNPRKDMEFVETGTLEFANRKDKIFWIRHLVNRFPGIKMNSLDLAKQKKAEQDRLKHVARTLKQKVPDPLNRVFDNRLL